MTKHFDHVVCEQWHKDIRHARWFYPRCRARASIAVMLKRFFGLFQNKDGMLGQNNYFCCCLLYCTVLYSTLNWGIKHLGSTTLFTGFCSIVLNWSHQCVKLCCSVCVFDCLCVMSERKVVFSARLSCFEWRASFWPEYRKFGELS